MKKRSSALSQFECIAVLLFYLFTFLPFHPFTFSLNNCYMGTVTAFDDLYMSMLPVTGHTLVFNDEFMLGDNFGLPVDRAALGNFVSADRPFKINFTMMMLCTEGAMRVRVNLKEFRIEKNGVLAVLPGSIGECLEISDDCRMAVIAYSDRSYEDVAASSFSISIMKYLSCNSLIRVSPGEMDVAVFLYQAMRKTMERSGFRLVREALIGYMQVLFCYGYQWMSDYEGNGSAAKPAGRQHQLFERFLDLVQRHYATDRSISFYADKMCITPKYLSAVVRQASGRLAGDWIRERVVLEAKALLRTRRYTARQVGDMLGFANPSFFAKYFKAATGVTPRKYLLSGR